MKKLLCFFIGTFLLIGSASAQCINLSPSTISAVADEQLHHYYLTFQNAGLSDNGQYALEYQFYYDGEPISEDSLGLYIDKDTSHIATKFMSNSFTGAYIAGSHGYFPSEPLSLFINLSTNSLNYFYGRYLKWKNNNGTNREQIRFSIRWLRSGNYTIEVKLLEMTGGTQNYTLNFNGSVPMGGDDAHATGNVIASTAFVTTKVMSDTIIYICYDELPYTQGDRTWTAPGTSGAEWDTPDVNGVRGWQQSVQFITDDNSDDIPCNINRLDSTQNIRVCLYPEVSAAISASGHNTTICQQTSAGYALIDITSGKAPFSIQPIKNGQNYGEPIEALQSGQNIRVGGLSEGTYTFLVTDANGCSGLTPTSIIIADAQQDNVISLTATPTHVTCYGGNNGSVSTSREVTTGVQAAPYIYEWSNQQSGEDVTNITGLTAGEYTVTVTDNMGCIGTATVTVSEAPAITNEVEVTCCNYQLPYRFDEQHADTIFTEAGTKQVKYTASNGCDSVVSVTLTVVTPSVTLSDITGTSTICAGSEATLSVGAISDGTNGDLSYAWSAGNTPIDNSNNASITVNPSDTTVYTVEVTATIGNCTATDTKSFTVNVNAPAVVLNEISGTSTICYGGETELSISTTTGTKGNVTYVWNTQETASSITVNPTENTTYSVVATATVGEDNEACSVTASKSVEVTVNDPAVTLSDITGTTTICKDPNGQGTILSVEPASNTGTMSYAWSNNRTQDTWNTASITVNPSDTTMYTVVATATVNTNNVPCMATDSKSITVNVNAPAVALNAITPATICQGGSTTLEVSAASHAGNLSYVWNEGNTAIANSNSASIEVSPNTTTTYSVVATATVGEGNEACTATATKSVEVTVNAPAVTLNNMTDVTICQGGSTTLEITDASHTGNLSYAWSAGNTAIDNSTSASISVNPETTTTYTVVVTATVNTNDVVCTATASKSVTVNVNAPAVTISDITGSSTICAGSSTTLSVVPTSNTGTVSYAWTAGGEPVGSNSSSISVSPNTTTEYTVVATATVGDNNVNCTATDTKTFTVNVNAPAVALSDITGNTTICKGDETTLSVEPTSYTGDVTYAWSNQETGNSITVSPTQNTTYIVTATATVSANNVSCTATDTKSISVTVNAPAITMNAISGDTHFCLGGSTQLTASTQTNNGTVTYAWTPATYLSTTEGATVTSTPTAAGTIEYEVTGTATISTNNVTCTITDSKQVTLTINDTVKLTASGNLTQRVCQNSEIATVTFSYENATITHTPIPAGLSYTDDEEGTVTISGTPTAAGEFEITITATSDESNPSCGSKTKKFNLTVDPEVTLSATNLTQSVCAGSSISDVEITNANSNVTYTDLPTGLTFANNGITGTPTVANNANNPHYTVTITATSNQTEPVVCQAKTQTFTLTVNPTVVLEADNLTQTVCAGSNITDVELEIEYANTPTFTYTKDGGNNVTGLPTGLTFNNNTITGAPTTAGEYVITITATSNQTNPTCDPATLTFNLTVNPTVTLEATNLTQSVCAGSEITAVEITYANANIPTFTYNIDDESENGLPEGLTFNNNKIIGALEEFGVYTITITAESNQTPACATVSQTFNLTINPTVVLEADELTQTVCAGSNITDVELEIEHANTPTFTYTINNENRTGLPTGLSYDQEDEKITGAPTEPGIYTITITATSDQTPACATATLPFNLTVNPTVTLSATNLEQSVCAGSNIADVTITTANANTPTFTYTKDGGNSNTGLPTGLTFSNNTIAGTPTTAGEYTITITATSNQTPACTAETETFTLTVKDLPTPALSNAVICASASDVHDTLTLTTDANMSNYSWNVDGGTILEGTNTNSIKVQWAATGAHTIAVTYTDPETECSATTQKTVTVYAVPEFTVTGNPANHSICAVEGNDIITVNSNSNTPYSYEWSAADGLAMEDAPTNNAKEFKSNTAGTYAVTIIGSETHDNLTCQTTQNVTVTVNAQPVLTVTPQNPTCFGGNNGKITTTVTGGTPAYTFDWSNNTHSNNAQNLTAGTYSVTVTDGNGCHATATEITLTDPSQITATKSNHVDVNCHGASTGAFTVTASNGTAFDGGQYLYKLGDDQEGTLAVSKTFNNLPAGNYVVTVSDRNGCPVEIKDTIREPEELTAGTISGPESTLCYNTGTMLTGATEAAGGNGTITYQWQILNDNTWTDIDNATNGASYTTGNLTATTQYRRAATNQCGTVYTEAVTVEVYPDVTAGTITAPEEPICYNTNTTLNATVATNGNGTIEYQWQSKSGNSDWANIENANDQNYITGNLTATTTFRRVDASCGRSANTNEVTVTVYPDVTAGTITAVDPICYNTNATLSASVATGGNSSYTYQWQSKSGNNDWANIENANDQNYTANNLTVTTSFRRVDASCGRTANTNEVTVTVYPELTAGAITAPASTLCYNASTTLEASAATGGNGTITYQWQVLNGENWSDLEDNYAANQNYTTGNLTATTQYRRAATNQCGTVYTEAVTVEVYPDVTAGTITAPEEPICYNTNTTLNATVATNGNGTIEYQWQSKSGNSDWANIENANDQNYITGNLTATTTFRRVDASCGRSANTNEVTVTVYPDVTAGTITAVDPICYNTNATLSASVATGGNSSYTYQWQSKSGNNDWANIENANDQNYTANNLTVTTSFRRVDASCGRTANTNEVTVTVYPELTAGAITAPASTLCYNASTTLEASAATGGNGAITYQWQVLNGENWSNLEDNYAANQNYTTGNLTTTTKYRRAATNSCGTVYTNEVTVNVYPALTASDITGGTTGICIGETHDLAVSVTAGSGNYSYNWQMAGRADSELWGNATGTNNAATYAAPINEAGTTYYKVTITDNCGNHQLTKGPVQVTVWPALAVENIANQTVCKDAEVTLTANATGGNGQYSYAWKQSTNGTDWTDATGTNDAASYTPSTATAGSSVTYKVVVTDNCENSVEKSATVTVYSLPTVNAGVDKTICVGTETELTASAENGKTPYTYQWFKGNTSLTDNTANDITYTTPVADATAGASTTYKVVVTDACGNTANDEVVVSVNAALTLTKSDSTDIICHGQSTGSITVAAANGAPNYQYKVDNGSYGEATAQTTATFSELAAGSHTVTVKDNCGTEASVTFVLREPEELALAVTAHSDLTCNGNNTGSITVTASNGTANYQYKIDNENYGDATAETTATFSGLAAGAHTITVMDNCSVEKTASYTLTEPAVLTLTESADDHQDVSCYNGTNGSVTVNVTGGTSTYQYKVGINGSYGNATAETSFTYANRPAEKDTLYVKDANGCEASIPVEITQPDTLELHEITASHIDVTCHGDADGEIAVAATGGFGTYLYNWNNGGYGGNSAKDQLTAGTYTIVVKDGHQCTASVTVVITEPEELTATIEGTNISCYDETDGTITVSVSGGTEPYTYRWNDDNQQNRVAERTHLAAGEYTVTVTDAHYCTSVKNITLTQPANFTVTVSGDAEICADETTIFTADTTGSNLTLQWYKDGVAIADSTARTLSNINVAAIYKVVATQSGSNCTKEATITLTVDTLPNVTITGESSICYNTQVTLTANNADSYVWGEDMGTEPSVTHTLIADRTYTVTGTNSYGCTASASHTVTVNALPSATLSFTMNNEPATAPNNSLELCAGGSITIAAPAANGVSYSWTKDNEPIAETGSTLNLSNITADNAGVYQVKVTNNETNCDSTSNAITIIVNALPTVTLSAVNNVTAICENDNTTLQATCTTEVSYEWHKGNATIAEASSNELTVSEAGKYVVIATDAHGCSNVSDTLTITVNALPTVTLSEDNRLTTICADSAFHFTATSTTATSYAWKHNNVAIDGATASTLRATEAGKYVVNVTDEHGCSNASDTLTVTVNPLPEFTISTGNNTEAAICSDGTLNMTAEATATYNYTWDGHYVTVNQETTSLAIFSHAADENATYTVSVTATDNNNCTKTLTKEVTVYALPVVTVNDPTLCLNGTMALTAEGATTYTWTPDTYLNASTGAGVTFTGSVAGTFDIVVTGTDDHNCSSTDTANVTVNALPTTGLTALQNKEICQGATTGWKIEGNYSDFAWTSTLDNSLQPIEGDTVTFTGTTAGEYTVTVSVTDANQCVNSASATVKVDTLPVVTLSSDNAVCEGNTITFTTAAANADNGIHNYIWTYPETNATVTGETTGNTLTLSWTDNGTKTVTVNYTDGNGCTATTPATRGIMVNELPDVVITNGETAEICLGGTVNLTAAGATSYVWANEAGNTAAITVEPKRDSTFTVTGTDDNGCSNTAAINITVHDTVKLTATHTTQTLCLGTAIEPIALTIANCTLDFGQMPTNELTYNETNNTITGELTTAGVHSFTITATSEHGCSSKSLPVFITMNDTVKLAAADTTQSRCLGTPITAIVLDTAHCTLNFTLPAGLTYNEADHQIEGEIATAGIHHFTVIATNGCGTKQVTGTITMNDTVKLAAADTTQTLCLGTPITAIVLDTAHCTLNLTLPAGLTYNEADHQIEGEIATAGIHHFTVIATNGCGTKQVTGTITMNDTVKLAAADTTQTLCLGAPITAIVLDTAHCTLNLTLPAGLSYNEDDHQIEGEIATAGIHHFTVTATNGCGTKQVTGTITMNDTAHFEADNLTQTLCLGTNITPIVLDTAHCMLDFGSMSNELNYNAAAHQIEGRLTTAGTHEFTITATAGNNCGSKTQNVSITMNDTVKLVALSPADNFSQEFCKGIAMTDLNFRITNSDNVALTGAPAGVTLAAVEAESETEPNYVMSGTPTATGTFNFTITASSEACEASVKTFNGTIIVDTIPAVAITTDAVNNTVCAGETITLTATAGYVTYEWNNEETESSFAEVADRDTYSVTVTNGEGCSNTATINITINALPTVTLSALDDLTTICADSAFHFTATCQSEEPTYAWKFNNTLIEEAEESTLRATEAGKYVVNVTDENGCSNVSDTLTVTVHTLPVVTTDVVNVSCTERGAVTLIITGEGTSFTCAWNGANPVAVEQTADGYIKAFSNLNGGDYIYAITDNNGCTTNDTVTVGDPGTITGTQSIISDIAQAGICKGSDNIVTFSIDGGTPDYTIEWVDVNTNEVVADTIVSDASTTFNLDDLAAGEYLLAMYITDRYGCSGIAADTIEFTVWPTYEIVREINIGTGLTEYTYGGQTYAVNNGVPVAPATEELETAHGCDSIISYVVNQYDLSIIFADTCVMTRSSYTRAYANTPNVELGDTIYVVKDEPSYFYAYLSNTTESTWNDQKMDMSYELQYNEQAISDDEMANLVSNFSISTYYDRMGVYYGVTDLTEASGEIPSTTFAFRQTANSTIMQFDYFYFDAFKNIPNKVTFTGLENGTYTLKLKAELRNSTDGTDRAGIYNPYIVNRKYGHLLGGYGDTIGQKEVIAARNMTIIVSEDGMNPSGAPAAINEYSNEASVQSFPNPVNDQLNLVINGMEGNTQITITDAQGKVVRVINAELTGSTEVLTYSVAEFAQGIYFLNVRNSEKVISQKFVVTRR